MKYIFVAGAPGSKWSSVVKNIYYSESIDRSDYSDTRTYYHDATGQRELMHLGAYFDPGMEFGSWFDGITEATPAECEAEFDRPFSGTGVRIVKSHVFCHSIDFLKHNWPSCAVVCVLRDPDASLGWWVRCGEFGITYPDYNDYYKNLRHMAKCIDHQNQDLERACLTRSYTQVQNNWQLSRALGIDLPPSDYYQDYAAAKIKVRVL